MDNLTAINVLDHGVVGDGTTDDGPAIQTVLDGNPTRRIYFPRTATTPGGVSYKCDSSLTVTAPGQALEGEVGGYGDGVILKFPEGVPGIIIESTAARATISNLILNGSEPWQQVLYYEGILPKGFGGPTDGNEADGIRIGANFVRLTNITVRFFGRHGINMSNADSGVSAMCDCCTLTDCFVQNCRGYGLYTQGADANANAIIEFFASVCQLGGFKEDSFLGNTYVGGHTAECHFDNAQSSVATLANLASISRASNVVTLTFTAPYTSDGQAFKPGQGVTVVSVSDTSFNGTFIVQSVAGAVLTYNQTAANASVSGSGQARMAKMIDTWAAAGLPTAGAIQTTQNTSNRTTWVHPYTEGGQNATGDNTLPGSLFGSGQTVIGGILGDPWDPTYGMPTVLSAVLAGITVGGGLYSFPSIRWNADLLAQYDEVVGKTASQTSQRRRKTFDGVTLWREDEGPDGWRRYSRDPLADATAVIRFGADMGAGGHRTYVNSEEDGAVKVNVLDGSGTGGVEIGNGAGDVVVTLTAGGAIGMTPVADTGTPNNSLFLGADHANQPCFKDGGGLVSPLGIGTGTQGPVGAPGPTGPPGPAGPTGPQGPPGTEWVRRSGSATIARGLTTVVVEHELGGSPLAEDIGVVSSNWRRVWLSGITSTTLEFRTDVAAPTGGMRFSYTARRWLTNV